MAITEDKSAFFDSSGFAVAVTIAGVDSTIFGHFAREYVDIGNLAGYRPVLTCATADIDDAFVGAAVSVAGETGVFSIIQKVKIDSIESKLILEV